MIKMIFSLLIMVSSFLPAYCMPIPNEFTKMSKIERERCIIEMWSKRHEIIQADIDDREEKCLRCKFETSLEWKQYLLAQSKDIFYEAFYNMLVMDRDIEELNTFAKP